MKTKLQRAVDATLEKYDYYLGDALEDNLGYDEIGFDVRDCRLCDLYLADGCIHCPIRISELVRKWSVYGCESLCQDAYWVLGEVGAVPAILAALCYLHGLVEEPHEDIVWCDNLQETA